LTSSLKQTLEQLLLDNSFLGTELDGKQFQTLLLNCKWFEINWLENKEMKHNIFKLIWKKLSSSSQPLDERDAAEVVLSQETDPSETMKFLSGFVHSLGENEISWNSLPKQISMVLFNSLKTFSDHSPFTEWVRTLVG
jgi:hypothetical protein